MSERFHRGHHDERAINELVAAADDRVAISLAREAEAAHNERVAALDQAESLWITSGFEDDFAELEATMGTSWVIDRNYPLLRVASFPSYDIVPRPVKLGARQIKCSRIFPEDNEPSVLVAIYGNVLFYRTQDDFNQDNTSGYTDRGFFTFIAQVRNEETGLMVPNIVYGDIDAAKWNAEPVKTLFVYDVLKAQETARDEVDILDFVLSAMSMGIGKCNTILGYMDQTAIDSTLSRFIKNRLFRGEHVVAGVFRQNQTAYIEGDTTAKQLVHQAMVQFMDNYIDPSQTVNSVVREAEHRANLGRLVFESTNGISLDEFDMAHAGLRAQLDMSTARTAHEKVVSPKINKKVNESICTQIIIQEESDFPFLKALKQKLSGSIYSWGGASYEYLLRDLLQHISDDSLLEKLNSEELTDGDKEIIKRSYRSQSSLEKGLNAMSGWSPDEL